MRWDGKTYADIVKSSVYTVLYSTEIPQAMTMGNKEYADFLKSHHEDLNFHYPDKHKPDVSAKRNTGITIIFKDRVLDDDGDKTISLTWSMAARHIRAWEYEKQEAEPQSRMREQWDNTHLCGSKYNDTLCEFFLKTDSDDTIVNGKKLDRCYYCTSENKVRKIGSGGSWTELSPKFCPKRNGKAPEHKVNEPTENDIALFEQYKEHFGISCRFEKVFGFDDRYAKQYRDKARELYAEIESKGLEVAYDKWEKWRKTIVSKGLVPTYEAYLGAKIIEEDNMARKLQLDAAITRDMKSAASDSFVDNIKMIEVDDILENDDNFYSISDIELLADDIEREGLMHNLVVSKSGTKYTLKSGHRRLAAIKLLIKEKRLKGTKIPCYVSGDKTEAETQFDLIMLNATQRKYSDADVMREYEEIERTFKALEAEGKPLKGRIRDNIAAVLKVSPAQVGKIENIKHNAVPEVEKAVKSGAMSISTANEVAKLPEEQQREIADNSPDISHKEVKKLQEKPSAPKAVELKDELDELDELLDDDDEPDEEPEVTPERKKSSRMFTLTLSEAEASTLLDFLNEWADADCDENAVLDVWNKLKAFVG